MEIEKYKAYWEYIMHIENSRSKQMRIFLVIVTSTMAVLTLLVDLYNDVMEIKNLYNILVMFCIGMTVYGVVLCLLFNAQKRYYDIYFEQIKAIETKYGIDKDAILNTNNARSMKTNYEENSFQAPAFFWYLLTVTLTVMLFSTTLTLVLSKGVFGLPASGNLFFLLLLAFSGALYFILALVFVIYNRKKNKEKRKVKKSKSLQ